MKIVQAIAEWYAHALECHSLGGTFPSIIMPDRYQSLIVEAAVKIQTRMGCPNAPRWPKAWSHPVADAIAGYIVQVHACNPYASERLSAIPGVLHGIIEQVGAILNTVYC